MEDKILDYFGAFDHNTRIVVAKYFQFESEAYLYAARLKEANIPCFISNSNMGTALPLGSGTISLHIRERDLQAASRIVKQLDARQVAEDSDYSFHDADLAEIRYQEKLHRKQNKPDWVIFSLLIIILLIIVRAYLRAAGWVNSWWDFF